MADEQIRLVEVLTTASAVANFLGEPDVSTAHLHASLRILKGEAAIEDLGRPVSPLVPRPGSPGSTPEARAFAQRWYQSLGGDPHATLTEAQIEEMERELRPTSEDTL